MSGSGERHRGITRFDSRGKINKLWGIKTHLSSRVLESKPPLFLPHAV